MISTVVIGTSLSETSSRTLCCLQELVTVGVRKVVLVHAMNIRDVGGLYHQLKSLAIPALERQKQLLAEMGFDVQIEVRLGLPFYEIQKVAWEHEATIIAVHLTTEALLETMFVGGVAYEVIQRADRPVLAMKASLTDAGCELNCERILQKILFPTDFSPNAELALDFLSQIVTAAQPSVTVVHVLEPASRSTEASDEAEHASTRLQAIEERLRAAGAKSVEVILRQGKPTTELLEVATKDRHSLIVMGSQGAGFIREVFLGSLSHNLVRYAYQPVLLVPAARD